MRKARIIGLLVASASVCGLVAYLSLRSREPVYQDKGLSDWVADFTNAPFMRSTSFSSDGSRMVMVRQNVPSPARDAIRQFGTNALPYLLHAIRSRDGDLKRRFVLFLRAK